MFENQINSCDEVHPIMTFCKDKNLRFLSINSGCADLVGLDRKEDIIGYTNEDLPINAYLSSDEMARFENEDKEALRGNRQLILDVHKYFGTIKTLIGKKTPLTNLRNDIMGVYYHAFEIITPTLAEINYLLQLKDISISKCVENNIKNFYGGQHRKVIALSPREFEVLYYTGRGKSARQTSMILKLSRRTVESYLENLKNKLTCHSKSDLIERSIDSGLVFIDPNKKQKNYFIDVQL